MTHRSSVRLLAALATAIAINSSHALGWMPDGSPLATVPRNQINIVASSDGEGGAIVVWQDSRNSSGESHSFDIYAQRIDAFGNTMWADDGVAVCTLPGGDSTPQLVPDGFGGVIVTWTRTNGAPGVYWDIYSQRVDGSGNSLWQTNGVPVVEGSGMQIGGGSVVDGAGGAIVIWYDAGDLFAQRILANGSPAWATNGITVCSKPGRQQVPAVGSDGAGGAIVAWEDTSSAVTNFDIYAQRISGSGTRLWATNGAPVCVLANRQRTTRIIPDPSGGAVVVWWDETTWPGTDLYMQRLNQAGTAQWTTNGIPLCVAPGFQNLSALRQSGGFLYAAWSDYRSGDADVYVQRIDWGGNVQWVTDGLAIASTAGDQSSARLVADAAGGVIVAWGDRGAGPTDIFAQRLDNAGQALWNPSGEAVCTAALSQIAGSSLSDGSGGAIVTWSDDRNGVDPDVYAQHLGPDGPTITAIARTPSVQGLNVLSNRPNPFGESSVVDVELGTPSDVVMEMFDVGGRRVREDRWPSRDAGWNRFDIRARDQDGRVLPSGVYFLRISAGHSTANHKIIITR